MAPKSFEGAVLGFKGGEEEGCPGWIMARSLKRSELIPDLRLENVLISCHLIFNPPLLNLLKKLKAPRFAIMVVSPSGEPYSFGHPSIEAVANRFLGLNQPPNDNNHPLAEARRQLPSFQYNQKLLTVAPPNLQRILHNDMSGVAHSRLVVL
ncbi:hypothetical protein WN943_027398 [Citrus x changshan-huyou]